jgi:hypothetical protein
MERELWIILYQLARGCDNAAWWQLGKFFRLRDRGSLLVGRTPRSTDKLVVSGRELAQRFAA